MSCRVVKQGAQGAQCGGQARLDVSMSSAGSEDSGNVKVVVYYITSIS